MRKIKILSYFFLAAFFAIACDDNAVGPENTIENKINSNKPFNRVVVRDASFTYEFFRNNPDDVEKLSDAYAERGYLILTTLVGSEKKTYYFSLMSAKKVETYVGKIFITY